MTTRDKIRNLVEPFISDGSFMVGTDYWNGHFRMLIEATDVPEADLERAYKFLQTKYPDAYIYYTTEKDRK